MSRLYTDILDDVISDRRSGAWVVARKAISCIEALAKEKSGSDLQEFIAEVERVCGMILKAQPGMALLMNLFNVIFMTIENEASNDTLALSRKIAGEATRFDENSRNAVSRVAEYGAKLIGENAEVLIHSNSSTVFEIIKKTKDYGKTFQVILTESRPVSEGRTCAAELSQLGIPATYFVDAAISKGVERADLILLGADSLSESHLINKIGSKAICLLAREDVVPCYSVCESSKFTPQKLIPKKEQLRDPAEVWQDPPQDTTVENYYFDIISLDLFTGIITEFGVLTPPEVGGKIFAQQMSPKLRELLK